MDSIVHGVAESRTWPSDFRFTFYFVGNWQTICPSSCTIFHPDPACPEGETDLVLGDPVSTWGCQRVTSAICTDGGDVSLWRLRSLLNTHPGAHLSPLHPAGRSVYAGLLSVLQLDCPFIFLWRLKGLLWWPRTLPFTGCDWQRSSLRLCFVFSYLNRIFQAANTSNCDEAPVLNFIFYDF